MKLLKTYFMLMVFDMERAATFYKRAVGLTERFTSPEWSELAFGDAVVALHGGRKTLDLVETGLGFEVDDIDAACRAVEAAGGKIVTPPKQQEHVDLKLATAADPEGNCFSIAQSG